MHGPSKWGLLFLQKEMLESLVAEMLEQNVCLDKASEEFEKQFLQTPLAGSDGHLKVLLLFDLARKSAPQLTEREREHLHVCEEANTSLKHLLGSSPNHSRRMQPNGGVNTPG